MDAPRIRARREPRRTQRGGTARCSRRPAADLVVYDRGSVDDGSRPVTCTTPGLISKRLYVRLVDGRCIDLADVPHADIVRRWRCLGRRIATAEMWDLRSSRRAPTYCPCCRRRKPISSYFREHAPWLRTAMARRRGGSVRRLTASSSRPFSSAGCGSGQVCATVRPPSAPSSRRLRG